MRFFGRSLLGVFLLAVTLGVLALAGQVILSAVQSRMADNGPAVPAREREFSAFVQQVKAGPVAPVLTVFGEVRSTRTLELRSPQAGTIIGLADGFEDGAAVKAGQVLVRLDPADAEAARDLAEADLQKVLAEEAETGRALLLGRDELAAAVAQAGLRAQALTRQNDLQAKGVGSAAAVETAALAASIADQAVLAGRQAVSQAETSVALAANAVARQRISLAEAERALVDTEIKAEFDGRLSDVAVVSGGVVGVNERLAQLIDPDALEVSFRLSTSQFVRLIDEKGQLIAAPVTVSLDVSGTEIVAQGRLLRVGAAVGEGQTGRLVYAALQDAAGFRPGDFVTVRIEEPVLVDAIVLPVAALGPRGDVLVLGEGDRLEAVAVEVLRRQDDVIIVRASDLVGREVVTERSPLLGEGIKVRPQRPDGAALAEEATVEMVALTPERRAELVALVEGMSQMPAEAKARVLDQLAQDQVPATVIARLEQRGG